MRRSQIAAFLSCMVMGSCLDGSAFGDEALQVDFDREVRPLLATYCLECHGPDAKARKGDLRFDIETDLHADRGGYRVIDPDRPEASELLRRVRSDDSEVVMPPADFPRRPSEAEIEVLQRWVAQGGTWADHWAFVPPAQPDVPRSENATWAHNGIDSFVLRRLQREEMRAESEADRVTLIRRLTQVLTGLPATPEEIDAYVEDQHPDAYARVISRLLASPAYGEHMAWAWLDAARYADSSGYQADWERFMWPWRDWVVRAYNANMPFDQFTVEQLAGDLLPNASMEQRLATGFNRNHRINDEGGSLDAEFEVEYVVDRVDTTATIWLGLTAGCARCHDHKYDPVSQKEFYRLYAYFNNVPEKGIDGRRGAAKPFMEVPNERVEAQLQMLEERLQAARRTRDQKGLEASSVTDAKDGHKQEIKELEEAIKNLAGRRTTQVMVMQEMGDRRPTYLLNRGVYDQPDTSMVLTPALPTAFAGSWTGGGTGPKDRLGLARWLVDPGNPLTARVTVNRLWQHHFGRGLVVTSEDFGTRGARPSHPELLDWLAHQMVGSDWDVKALHRLIVESATFRQRARVTPDRLQKDPANQWLARGPRRRLSGPAIRDQALFVSGLLSRTMGGAPVKPYQPEGLWKELSFGTGKTSIDFYVQDYGESLYRRGVYTFWKRTVAPPRMAVFDGTGREMCRVRTALTNTPMQALTLQNDVTFVEAARHLAQRVLLDKSVVSHRERLGRAWRLVLGRVPEADELRVLEESLGRYLDTYGGDRDAAKRLLEYGESDYAEGLDVAEHAAFTMLAQTLLNLDESITRE